MRIMITLAFSAAFMAGAAQANVQEDLAQDKEFKKGMLEVVAASKIAKKCDSIRPRYFRLQSRVSSLKKMARARGYSKSEINAYINDDANKKEMRKRRNIFFESKGASFEDVQSLCVLGHAEISKGSAIGSLLKAK